MKENLKSKYLELAAELDSEAKALWPNEPDPGLRLMLESSAAAIRELLALVMELIEIGDANWNYDCPCDEYSKVCALLQKAREATREAEASRATSGAEN